MGRVIIYSVASLGTIFLSGSVFTSIVLTPGMSVSAALTGFLVVTAPVAIIYLAAKHGRPTLTVFAPWAALVLFSAGSLAFRPSLPGLQHLLALMAFIAVLIVAFQLSAGWDPDQFGKLVLITGVVAGIISLLVFLSGRFLGHTFPDLRSYSLAYLVGLALIASAHWPQKWFIVLPWIIWLSIADSGSRMATVAGTFIVVTALIGRKEFARWLRISYPLFASTLAGALYFLLYQNSSSWIRGAWSAGDKGLVVPIRPGAEPGVDGVFINTNGRVDAWQGLIAELSTSSHWWFGRGTGFSADFVRREIPTFDQALNEYVRLLTDNGIVGLSLFLAGLLSLFLAAWLIPRENPRVRALALYLVGVLAFSALTEPPLLYVFFFAPLAVFLGIALGHGRNLTVTNGASVKARVSPT